jgi:hypothetical protein
VTLPMPAVRQMRRLPMQFRLNKQLNLMSTILKALFERVALLVLLILSVIYTVTIFLIFVLTNKMILMKKLI